jgi:uncharacterized RDD family membrane protein YckC
MIERSEFTIDRQSRMTDFTQQHSPGPYGHDQLTIETPEQVALRFPIAGVGSRFLAALADTALQIVAYLAIVLIFVLIVSAAPKTAAGQFSHTGEKWLIAILILIHFVMYWGYFTLFEAFKNGQTPGKMLFQLRVIQDSGRQITFFEAMTRNLIRIIDLIPGFYLTGVIAMLCNRWHKRLGDLAAGTLVVHERGSEEPIWGGTGPRTFTAASFAPSPAEALAQSRIAADLTLPADAIARLSVDDLSVIDRFFSRILDMDLTTRAGIAGRLATQMTAKMKIEIPADLKPERLLEAIVHQMRAQGGR